MCDLQDLDPIPGKAARDRKLILILIVWSDSKKDLRQEENILQLYHSAPRRTKKRIIRIYCLIQFKKSGTFCNCLFQTEANYTQERKKRKNINDKTKREEWIRFQKGRSGTGGWIFCSRIIRHQSKIYATTTKSSSSLVVKCDMR